MGIDVGSKVIYPSQGPCLIGPVIWKDVAGRPMSFYSLMLLDGSGGELFVPVDRVQTIGLRPLLEKSEIPKLLAHLMGPRQSTGDWKQRAKDNLKLLVSSSAYDLAQVVKSLSDLNKQKVLSFRENKLLEKAKKLLVCEISAVMGNTLLAAEEHVNCALKARKILASETISFEY